MSRPTTLDSPLARLRLLTGRGRQQFAASIDLAQSTLEKLERGERRLTPAVAHRILQFTGVCPECLKPGARPIHTLDGYPYTEAEFARWQTWQDLPQSPAGHPAAQTVAMGSRPHGPLYDATCCEPVGTVLLYAPLEGSETAGMARKLQGLQRQEMPRMLARNLIDLARGVAQELLKDRKRSEARLLDALHALRKLCPTARPQSSEEEEELVRQFTEAVPSGRARRGGKSPK